MTSQQLLAFAALGQLALLLGAFLFGAFRLGGTGGMLRRMERNADRMEATVNRMEAAGFIADADRTSTLDGIQRIERADRVVAQGRSVIAENLADTHSRADATVGAPGEAADAALRTGDTAAAIMERQHTARPLAGE